MTKKEPKKENWRKGKRNGNGSIRTNANGTYTARLQWIDDSGKRQEVTHKAATKREAKEYINKMSEERKNFGDRAIQSDRMTLNEVAQRFSDIKLIPAVYQDNRRVTGLRSVASVKSALKPIVAHFGKRRLRDIRTSDLEAYKNKRLTEPTSIGNGGIKKLRKVATVNRELQVLRQIFRFAKSDKLITSSPFDDKNIISPSMEVERERVLDFEEEGRLLSELTGPREHLRAIVITALDTAMRRGELFKLKWGDVDLHNGLITIQATNTKTERTRTVAMTVRAREELTQLWQKSPQDYSQSVFGITDIKRSWKTACKLAGIDNLRFHDLRHTATTRLIRAKVPQAEAMKITGHSQLKTFQRYMNLTHESVTASAKSLDEYLNESRAHLTESTIGLSGVQ